MPKQTFFNLKEEKKRKLIEAAREEFSRVSLYDASITNILKTAGIPRGSFYQYFEDKEDAFFYLLNEHAEERHQNFLSSLEKYNGDLFLAMTEVYRNVLDYSQGQGNSNFIRNALLNMNYKIEHTFTKHLMEKSRGQRANEIYNLVETDSLNIALEEDFYHVMQIMIAITFHNLVHCLSNDFTTEEALDKYTKEIELIKSGLMKSNN
ncbi:TetR/AcrR family transcriptional regulator [Thalassobacillus pellis]|uniref:TetR/AcrR family transcriptional regulator n=1 Tax=Thalassobacillus pellis TaxID=748008 RepID=UPI00195F7693|nr:TetR family transcriptional regulator [Thalassobacillus pellis]MBM7553769.1 AcrR family transcriptional regulator [Thalassobacillus pellis]